MEYIIGDAVRPAGPGNKLIIHIVNDIGLWGAGFVLALSRRWAAPEKAYRQWSRGNEQPFALGEVQFVSVMHSANAEAGTIHVANMVAQRGVHNDLNPMPLRLDALEECLQKVEDWSAAFSAIVHAPRIGCGLAGGKWEDVEKLINKFEFANYTTIYDLPEA